MVTTTAAESSRGAWFLMVAIAAVALLLSAYLTYASTFGAGPVGCGGGSGCGEVLGSKWSKLLGLPVSGFAVLAYAGVLGALFGVRLKSDSARRASWAVLAGLAALVAASAAWFIFLQFAVLGAICPYCMADHALGLLLAVFVFASAPRRSLPAIGAPAGVLAVVVMALLQWATPAPMHRATGVDVAGDTDVRDEDIRRVELLGGTMSLDVGDEPHLGPVDAERVLVLVFDYACPHCRQAHGVFRDYLASADAKTSIVLVLAPTPVHRGCNPFALEEMPARFDESCELARVALAVHRADPAGFEAFDAWMFEPEMPRSAAEARAKGLEMVGAEAFAAAYDDPRTAATIARNVAAYGKLGDDRRVPAVLLPGREPVIGPIEDAAALATLLAEPAAVPPAGKDAGG